MFWKCSHRRMLSVPDNYLVSLRQASLQTEHTLLLLDKNICSIILSGKQFGDVDVLSSFQIKSFISCSFFHLVQSLRAVFRNFSRIYYNVCSFILTCFYLVLNTLFTFFTMYLINLCFHYLAVSSLLYSIFFFRLFLNSPA